MDDDNFRGDVRDLSYDDSSAVMAGQLDVEIAAQAFFGRIEEQRGERAPYQGKPSRYYLLRHLGLVEQAEALIA